MRVVGNRRSGVLFAVGSTVGFLTAFALLNLFPTSRTATRARFGSIGAVPDSPHSHVHVDPDTGLAEAQQWNDFEDESHRDEIHTLASELRQTVRILCWVMTSPTNIETKARHVNATWGQRCNVLLFMSSQPDASLPAIGLNVPEGHDNLWGKTKAAFKYVYEHHFEEADFFLKADDDTYAVIENLRYLLKDYDRDEPIYFGRRFRPYVRQGYMSGGAGYVLSREALKRFVTKAIPHPHMCSSKIEGYEDVEIGLCLQNTGVRVIDSRDKLGRERFHPFPPELHLIPGAITKDNWYWEYNYYPIKEGPECCSDYSITFHYIPPNLMYVFEYLIYHMKPYGLTSSLVRNGQSQRFSRTSAVESVDNHPVQTNNVSAHGDGFSTRNPSADQKPIKEIENETKPRAVSKKIRYYNQTRRATTNAGVKKKQKSHNFEKF